MLLVLWTNALCAGDGHYSAGDERIENAHSNFTPTHITASYELLPNKTCLELTSENGDYHAAEIQKASSRTIVSSVALNWSSSPSK